MLPHKERNRIPIVSEKIFELDDFGMKDVVG